ncbi:MAG: LamG domain-containing protein, partial [Verrucomicrobia bacterium]|nr:LamG domain-containing protein [Verrucomicrobiota bacterium]
MKTKIKKWLSVALLAAMTAVNVQAQPAELIAGWDFEQSDLGADGIRSSETGNNYEALYEGEIEISPEGRIGSGLDASLDTDGYLFLEAEGEDNPLNIAAENDQVSVVFWQYNRSNPNSSTFWSIGESQDRWFQAHVPWSNGNIYFDSMGCCANPTQRINGAPGEDHEWIEEWHHYAFIKNEDYKAVYVDGALLLETADGGATELTVDVTRFWIGSDNGGGNQPDAIIDQLGIFKGALTAAEIAEIAGGKSIFEPPVDT